ncbi:hypothetical protein [Absidia glauca]|uniref:Uncharacterized protein n=1 Tax=Absidia glauca TaxID=4829 RepID=A0A163LPR8_ABSGL|nr:hypothetical protein [Absidia glauca]
MQKASFSPSVDLRLLFHFLSRTRIMNEKETLQKDIERLKAEYEDACIQTGMTEDQVNNVLKRRMALIKEWNDRQTMANTLLSKYAIIKNCTLRQALDEFEVPDNL